MAIPCDYDKLTQDIERVVQFSQGINFPLPKTGNLVSIWAENKERFFKLFDNQLILTSGKKVTVELTDNIKNDLIDTFISRSYSIIPRSDEEDFVSWIEANREGFFNNRIVSPLPQTTMRENGKLLRAFKYFVSDPQKLRELQDLASQFIQQSKIEGYLCLSIHPLDYLSASENNSNWRSCHSLDGEYRAGNLSYMLDKTTFICYLRPATEVQLRLFPEDMLWNDKKWRMYVSVSENNEIAFFSRQYPFSCDTLVETVLRHLYPLQLGNLRYNGFKKIINSRGEDIELDHNFLYYRYADVILDTRDICSGHRNALNYNDIINSPSYTPMFAVKRSRWFDPNPNKETLIERFKTVIGEEVPCLLCGEPIDDSNEFLCDECWEREIEGVIGHCDECGCSIYEGDIYKETPAGLWLCEDCMEVL